METSSGIGHAGACDCVQVAIDLDEIFRLRFVPAYAEPQRPVEALSSLRSGADLTRHTGIFLLGCHEATRTGYRLTKAADRDPEMLLHLFCYPCVEGAFGAQGPLGRLTSSALDCWSIWGR